MRAFTITSTLCHAILPRTDKDLTENELVLLKDNLGLDIKSEAETSTIHGNTRLKPNLGN